MDSPVLYDLTVLANRAPEAVAGGPYTVDEGSSVALDGSGSWDPDGDVLTFAWDLDNDGVFETPGVNPAFYGADDVVSWPITLRVVDPFSETDTDTSAVTVNNVAPSITEPWTAAPAMPVPIGSSQSFSAAFTDPGTLDAHAALWDWGDGSTAPGTVTEGGGAGSVDDTHVYTTPGVYPVTLTLVADDGGSDSSIYQYVVVYDPNDGFVTGGGWIMSPAGAYVADPALTGKATFGFVSKYQKGATVPTGNTEFQFHAAGLNFKSTSYEWLVIAGSRAQYKGEGTINGTGQYGFMLKAIDGQVTGGGGVDKFRIMIWDKDNGDAVVYDNLMGGALTDDPVTALGGGSIVIHKVK